MGKKEHVREGGGMNTAGIEYWKIFMVRNGCWFEDTFLKGVSKPL